MATLTKETGLDNFDIEQDEVSTADLPEINGKQPNADFIRVTPDIARAWLGQNHDQQRNIRENRVDRYAKMMEDGLWKIASDAVAFDTNGDLINGQHRLRAIVESEEPQWMLVVWNLDPETRKYIDEGIKRSPSDALAVHGFEDPVHVAAAVRLVVFWRRNELEHCAEYDAIANYEIVQAAEECSPRIYDSVEFAAQHKTENIRPPRSLITFCHFIYEPTYGNKAEAFLNKTCTGLNISNDDWEDGPSPVQLLRKKMTDEKGALWEDMERHRKLGFMIQAMNWYCMDDPGKRLRYHKGDSMPEPAVDEIPEYSMGEEELFE